MRRSSSMRGFSPCFQSAPYWSTGRGPDRARARAASAGVDAAGVLGLGVDAGGVLGLGVGAAGVLPKRPVRGPVGGGGGAAAGGWRTAAGGWRGAAAEAARRAAHSEAPASAEPPNPAAPNPAAGVAPYGRCGGRSAGDAWYAPAAPERGAATGGE